jgi:molecular chaperone GrpE
MSEPEVDTRTEGDSETERLRHSLEEARQQGVRLLADFENLRRRTGREQGLARQEGIAEALRALLPVLDAFERALEVGSSDRSFYKKRRK